MSLSWYVAKVKSGKERLIGELLLPKDKERPMVGYTTLEVLGFKVNPITGKLEKTVAIEY